MLDRKVLPHLGPVDTRGSVVILLRHSVIFNCAATILPLYADFRACGVRSTAKFEANPRTLRKHHTVRGGGGRPQVPAT